MKKILILLLVIQVSALQAQFSELEKEQFTRRIIESGKERARSAGETLVIIENNSNAILIFTAGKFEGIRCQTSRKKVGMSIVGMEYTLIDKNRMKIIKNRKTYRYRSCYADRNSIRLRKENFT